MEQIQVDKNKDQPAESGKGIVTKKDSLSRIIDDCIAVHEQNKWNIPDNRIAVHPEMYKELLASGYHLSKDNGVGEDVGVATVLKGDEVLSQRIVPKLKPRSIGLTTEAIKQKEEIMGDYGGFSIRPVMSKEQQGKIAAIQRRRAKEQRRLARKNKDYKLKAY